MKISSVLVLFLLLLVPATSTFAAEGPAPMVEHAKIRIVLKDAGAIRAFQETHAAIAEASDIQRDAEWFLTQLARYSLTTAESQPVPTLDPANQLPEAEHLVVTLDDPHAVSVYQLAFGHLRALAGRDLTNEEAVVRMSELYRGAFDSNS